MASRSRILAVLLSALVLARAGAADPPAAADRVLEDQWLASYIQGVHVGYEYSLTRSVSGPEGWGFKPNPVSFGADLLIVEAPQARNGVFIHAESVGYAFQLADLRKSIPPATEILEEKSGEVQGRKTRTVRFRNRQRRQVGNLTAVLDRDMLYTLMVRGGSEDDVRGWAAIVASLGFKE